MTIPLSLATEIRRLYFAEHWPVGTIAAQLHVHHETVRRALGLLPAGAPGRRTDRPSLLDPYRDFIAGQLALYPRLRATRIYDMIAERGYTGSMRTVRRHVALVRPEPAPKAYLRLDPLPGEQAQVDWAYLGKLQVSGGERALWVFLMVLSHSRAIWGELVLDLSSDSLRRSLVRAAAWFGGSARQWLFDNPRTVVLERHQDAARFHPDLLELASHYCAQLRLCNVRKANEKGRVERAVRYLRDRHFAGRVITSVHGGNEQLLQFLSTTSLDRPHPTIAGRTVGQVLAEERERLLPLPATTPDTDLVRPVAVDKTACIRFDTNTYSVPPEHVGKTLVVAASDTCVRVLAGTAQVARHERCWGRRQLIEDPAHRAAILEHKRAAADLKGRDRLRAVCPQIDQLYTVWLDSGHNLGSLTARAIKLLDLYGDDLFTAAAGELVSRGLRDVSALGQICEQMRRAADKPVPLDVPLSSHVPDRDVIPHALEDYDV
mgnify:CR=1 FL=1